MQRRVDAARAAPADGAAGVGAPVQGAAAGRRQVPDAVRAFRAVVVRALAVCAVVVRAVVVCAVVACGTGLLAAEMAAGERVGLGEDPGDPYLEGLVEGDSDALGERLEAALSH